MCRLLVYRGLLKCVFYRGFGRGEAENGFSCNAAGFQGGGEESGVLAGSSRPV